MISPPLDKSELLSVIFGYLDTLELLQVSSVCRLWNDACDPCWKSRFRHYDRNEPPTTKSQFLQQWHKEQIQFWRAHERANLNEAYSQQRQLDIARNATDYQYLIRFSYPRFHGFTWNGMVPLQKMDPILLQQDNDDATTTTTTTTIGYRLQFDMKDLSFRIGKSSSWERLFAVYYPYDKRKGDVLEELRNDPDCPFSAMATSFDPHDFYIAVVAFQDDRYHTLVPCQNSVMKWEATKDYPGCLQITYGGYILYLGNLRFEFQGRPGTTNTGGSTFQLETMSVCIFGNSLNQYQ